MEPISIPINDELEAFKEHLKINERTIFSAKFGDGKTFFLNEFKKECNNKNKINQEDKYYFITLYPVNYSIADNQDIFEYIKRDILLQLANDKKLNSIDFEAIAKSIFTWENLKEVICFLISCIPKGKILNTILEKGEKFLKKYEQEQNSFQNYNAWFTSQKGGLYEHDGYTEVIIEALKHIKESGYKTVLIIEDLDRVDPAHLFRILNVFGAHIDEYLYNGSEKTNKFGFDNIIIVFDYNTTENIFHHFYGKEANYKGYMTKFTSHQPFYYSIDKIAQEYLYRVINEKCHISKEAIQEIFQLVNTKNGPLSVRDVNNILNGIDLYTKKGDTTHFENESYGRSPLTYTIALFKLLGVNNPNDIKVYIKKLPDLDLLNCINVFFYTDPQIILYQQFIYHGKSYTICNDNNKIQIKDSFQRASRPYEFRDEQVEKYIDKAFEYTIK